MDTKRCSKCGKTKHLLEFCVNNKRKDGRSSHCKECHNTLYYDRHPLAFRVLQSGDEKTCTKCGETKPVSEFDTSLEDRSGYTSQCKACRRESARNWKRRHRNEMKDYNAEFRQNNKNYFRRWWKENRDKAAEYTRRFYSSERGILYNRDSSARRRTVKLDGNVTVDYLERLFATQTHCAYCNKPFSDDLKPTIDHIVPISKGGTHTTENVTLACKSCNSSKSDRQLETLDVGLKY